MLNFDFSEKPLGIVSLLHFVYGFSRKIFCMLYSVSWTNFIVLLSLLLQIFGNTYIVIVCFLACDVINFEIKLIFLINPFFYMTEKSQKS